MTGGKVLILNGYRYMEVDRGRFEVTLLEGGREIAHTEGDKVIMYAGRYEDVADWASLYDIETIEQR